MNVSFKITGLDNILNDELTKFDNKSVTVGYLKDDKLALIAKVQEYGAVINVTQKLRNYLGMKHGIWLSKDKTQIIIPPRSFMLAAFFDNQNEYADRLMKFYAISGDIDEALDKLGETIQKQDIPNSINEHYIKWQKNSDMTILLKGFDKPLVGKGNLITDIDRQVNT